MNRTLRAKSLTAIVLCNVEEVAPAYAVDPEDVDLDTAAAAMGQEAWSTHMLESGVTCTVHCRTAEDGTQEHAIRFDRPEDDE